MLLTNPVGVNLARNSVAVTIQNDDPLPALAAANASITEGNTGTKTVSVNVTLSAASSAQVTVAYATVAGTATAGVDYLTASGTLTFAPGVTTQTVKVTIVGDTVKEANETFQVESSRNFSSEKSRRMVMTYGVS